MDEALEGYALTVGGRSGCFAIDGLLKFTRFVHFHHDVRPADEFSLHIQLRDGGPVAVFLDTLADGIVFQHIHGFQGFGFHAAGFQNLNSPPGKTAHGEAGTALHEQNDVVVFDQIINALLCVAHAEISVVGVVHARHALETWQRAC